jgi:hypothetical protein
MPLTNAEKQARYREKHILKRRMAQRIVNLLVLKHWTDEHIKEVAHLLAQFFYREEARMLRRELGRLTETRPPSQAIPLSDVERQAWKEDHPGKRCPTPEHPCFISDREFSDLARWRRQRERKARRQRGNGRATID